MSGSDHLPKHVFPVISSAPERKDENGVMKRKIISAVIRRGP